MQNRRGLPGQGKRPPSVRALRDAELDVEIQRIHADNYGVYFVVVAAD